MNKQRRKDLNKLIERLEAVGAEVEEVRGDLECLKDEEQEYYDNMPESIQGSDKGSAAEEQSKPWNPPTSICRTFWITSRKFSTKSRKRWNRRSKMQSNFKCNKGFEVQVLPSAGGWYIGTRNTEGEPMCRLSANYYPNAASAQFDLYRGDWTLRDHAMEIQFCCGGPAREIKPNGDGVKKGDHLVRLYEGGGTFTWRFLGLLDGRLVFESVEERSSLLALAPAQIEEIVAERSAEWRAVGVQERITKMNFDKEYERMLINSKCDLPETDGGYEPSYEELVAAGEYPADEVVSKPLEEFKANYRALPGFRLLGDRGLEKVHALLREEGYSITLREVYDRFVECDWRLLPWFVEGMRDAVEVAKPPAWVMDMTEAREIIEDGLARAWMPHWWLDDNTLLLDLSGWGGW